MDTRILDATEWTGGYPLKIVADLHYRIVGGKLKKPADLKPIFDGYETVILNGDSVEQHLYGTRRSGEHRKEIEDVAASVGAKPIFLRGNHDPAIGPAELRIQNRGRTLRIAHGDFGLVQLEPSIEGAMSRPFTYIWYTLRTVRSYPVYWRQIRLALEMMKENEIFVLGHTHRPSLTRSGSKTVVNLGAHMRGFTDAWMEIEKEDGDIILCGKTRSVV